MKNLKKALISVIVTVLLLSIISQCNNLQAQTKYTPFQCFVLTYGGDFTFEGNTKAIQFYNEVNHTRFTTFDELYNSNETIAKEFTSTCDKVNNVNYSIKSTPQEVEKQIIKVDSLVSNDIIFTDVEVNHTINVKAITLVEEGDLLIAYKKHKNYSTIYNETKDMWISIKLADSLGTTEICPKKLNKASRKDARFFIVGQPTEKDVSSTAKNISMSKEYWKGMKTNGKELGSTPKRTDTKFSIPLLYEWDTCRSRRVLLFGLIKL